MTDPEELEVAESGKHFQCCACVCACLCVCGLNMMHTLMSRHDERLMDGKNTWVRGIKE